MSMSDDRHSELSQADVLNGRNATAVESISDRLGEVTQLAEQLDMALRGAQEDCHMQSAHHDTANTTNGDAAHNIEVRNQNTHHGGCVG